MSRNKVLIVDDYRENIEALSQLLGSEDLELHTAQDANTALELLTQHDFCLALLDVQMPNISGFELARLIRGVKKFHLLPIIFVTASQEDQAFLFEGYESGAVDLLFKPLNPHAVRAKVKIFVELHEQKMLLQEQLKELEELRIAAEAANLAKSQFLANMSHEIRTPLGAVLGFAQLLAKSNFSDEKKMTFLSAIQRNGHLLQSLIDDILDLSRIEANKLELESVDFDLHELIGEVQSTLLLKAREKGVELIFNVKGEIADCYLGDPTRIKQIFFNLIGNAIKFTNQGQVETTFAIETRDGSSDRMRITIRDEGIGLNAAQAERLFQPFSQGDASTRRQFGGSGLGLVISQQIAKCMGGNIRLLRSAPGEGSTFEAVIPLVRSLRSATACEEPRPEDHGLDLPSLDLNAKHILIVDDVSDNLTLIEQYLKPTGANLSFARNGFEALERVRSQTFDLILLDIQMPGMDGHEAAAKMREMKIATPILAITAHAIKDEKEKILKSGCDDVYVKPIDSATLMTGIARHLSLPTNKEPRIHRGTQGSPRNDDRVELT